MIFCPKKTISSFWDKLKDATNKMFGNYFLLPITTVFFTLLVYSLKLGHSRPLFFTFVFSTVNRKFVHYKILPMTGFELRTSGIGSDRSAN